MQRLIILRGYPASGKSTIGEVLESAGIGVFVDHNRILSFIAEMTGDDDGIYDDIHQLELAMTRKLLTDGKSAIVARGFTKADNLESYKALAIDKGVPCNVFRLDGPVELLEKRVVASERKHGFNPSTTVEALRIWIEENPMDSIDNEIVLDVSQPVGSLTRIIRKKLENVG